MGQVKQLMIVESPAKAKTIKKYLGDSYSVLASYGHVCGIPSKQGAVNPEQDFFIDYEMHDKAKRHIDEIVKAARNSEAIYLATDPDREGEAISWHIVEMLKKRGAIKDKEKVKRVIFHEITANAIKQAITQPRSLDMDLVSAQQTRQALDYLVGFTLSPVLWRKLPGSKSAGRVQSVALRLICEREAEIRAFRTQEYWTIEGKFSKVQANESFKTRLVSFEGKKLQKYDISTEEEAKKITAKLASSQFSVNNVETKLSKRGPMPPFTTSTMIQEANRKLHFTARKTAQIAQKLYEGAEVKGELSGLITYMRTDSIIISQEAAQQIANFIGQEYGKDYVPTKQRIFKNKAKNAQEAHEAIRPTDIRLKPQDAGRFLDRDSARLYELIWKRTVASQMADAELEIKKVEVKAHNDTEVGLFKGQGYTILFPGFYAIDQDTNTLERENKKTSNNEGEEDTSLEGGNQVIPELAVDEELKLLKLEEGQHYTKPPSRYSEASLVKKMEELGIGRPSTYPAIISVLQLRNYVSVENRSFIPQGRGVLVCGFLSSFFNNYVNYDFTAHLEDKLDEIAQGQKDAKEILKEFWQPFKSCSDQVLAYKNEVILQQLEKELEDFLFGEDSKEHRCPQCNEGHLVLKNSRYGSFLGCSAYPACDYTRDVCTKEVSSNEGEEGEDNNKDKPKAHEVDLGLDEQGNKIKVKKGPYGLYLQLGGDTKGDKGKTVTIPKDFALEEINLALALKLLELPKVLGQHYDTGKDVIVNIGRYGPYVGHNGTFASAPPKSFLSLNLDQAIDLLIAKQKDKEGGEGKKKRFVKKVTKE